MSNLSIKDCLIEDYDEVLKLNNASTPMVNEIGQQELQELSEMACYFKVAVDEQKSVVGTLLVLPAQQMYKSLNYQWFNARYTNFYYVDRIFVREDYLNQGIGRSFYQDLLNSSLKERGIAYLCCEVNIEPMNQPSLSFHHQFGFAEVGQRESSDNKRVSMLLKTL